jgi:lipopolysaccharide biosynthesis glycosyltransferase
MTAKAETAVCYITDVNFLPQALATATRLRSFVSADVASIYCVVINMDEDALKESVAALQPLDIEVLHLSEAAMMQFDKHKFRQSNISYATLGRFFLDALLPKRITRVVYFDADTWPRRDPSALIHADIPEGRFAAVDDMMSYTHDEAGRWGKFVRGYFRTLNIDARRGYFNAGIFATSRKTLREIGDEAFVFFRNNTETCHHHDQSALNAVVGDRRIRLSSRWNFQTPFRSLDVEQKVAPRLYHFTEYPKAWMGVTEPWSDMHDELSSVNAPWAELVPRGKQIGAEELSKYNSAKRSARLKFHTLFLPRLINRRKKFMEAEANVWM